MCIKNLISILVLFSLLTACQLTVAPPPTQPSNVDAVGTAVELTTVAKLTEIAGSAIPVTATFTAVPTPTSTPDSAVSVPVSGPCGPTVTATVNANVRSGPGTAYDTVGSLMLGQTATIVGRNDAYTWWYIAYPGVSGGHAWIAGSVVTSACVPSVVQVVAAPPLPTEEPVVAASSSDDTEESTESEGENEEINTLPLVFEAVTFSPDLVAVSMRYSPERPREGEPVTVSLRIENQGNGEAKNFTVKWWATSSDLGRQFTVSSLPAGEVKAFGFTYTYHTSRNQRTRLVVDSGNAVNETNEDNNTLSDYLVIVR